VGISGQDRGFTLLRGEPTANVHIAFPVADDDAVREFYRVAVAAGYRDNGGPGERSIYHPGYYGAFVLDPDGNNIEAVNHNR
jgi:catechol 2,3-dioxygenase-like lactoylglutathione lyase family enzyme